MWQIQIFNYNTRRWENYGKASLDFHALYKKCESLQEAGHKARLEHLTEPTISLGEPEVE